MYKKKKRSWVKHLDFILIDMLAAEIALFLGVLIKFQGAVIFISRFDHYPLYEDMALLLPFMDLAGVLLTETYTGILRRTKYQEAIATIGHCLVNVLAVLLYMQAMKTTFFYSRLALGVAAGFMVVLSYVFRCLWKRVVRQRMLKDVNKSSLIIVADSDTVDECLSELAHSPYMEFKVNGVAVMDKDMSGQEIQGVPVVANADTLFEYLRTNVVDEVFLDGNTRSGEQNLAARMVELGLTVHLSLIHADNLMPNRIMETYGRYVVLTSSMHIASNRQAFIKRVGDILGALIGLVFVVIAFIIFAPIIKLQSKGPVFFCQTRIGKNGRRFKFYKFRTMHMDAEERKKELMKSKEICSRWKMIHVSFQLDVSCESIPLMSYHNSGMS